MARVNVFVKICTHGEPTDFCECCKRKESETYLDIMWKKGVFL